MSVNNSQLSRRQFLTFAGTSATIGLLAACGAATPTTAPATSAPAAAAATDTPAAAAAAATDTPAAAAATDTPAAAGATDTPAAGTGEMILIQGRGADSSALDPGIVTDGESARVCWTINDPLVTIEGKTTKVMPWLAESFTTTDSKVWTFKLRQNVKFHDGTVCDAEAVKWNFDRWSQKDFKYRYASQKYEYWDNELSQIVDSYKVVDPTTFEVTLKVATTLLLPKLAIFSFGIVSPKAVQDQGEKYATQTGTPVGTGRFKFDSWVPNDKITVVRNDDWWGSKVKLDYTEAPKVTKLIFRSIPDNSARFAEFQAGTLDLSDLAQTDLLTMEGNPDYDIVPALSLSNGYIAFNQAVKPFDKLEVRQAIAHAVDWAAIVKNFYDKYAEPAGGFQPPAILGHNPNIKPYTYDQTMAKDLLKTAGLPDGFTADFWYLPVIRGYFPDGKAIGEAIAADLAKVGIKVNLKTEDWTAYLKDRADGKFSMWMLGWGSDNGDPDNFIGYHFLYADGKNPNKEDSYKNDKLQALLRQGQTEADVAKREKIYQDAEQIVYDDVARITVAWVTTPAIFPKRVKGWINPLAVFRDWYEFYSVTRS
jgi:peptide/nickel transport system substrate-binding protein